MDKLKENSSGKILKPILGGRLINGTVVNTKGCGCGSKVNLGPNYLSLQKSKKLFL